MKKFLFAASAALISFAPMAAQAASWHMPEWARKTCSNLRSGDSAYDAAYNATMQMAHKPGFIVWLDGLSKYEKQELILKHMNRQCPGWLSM